MGMMANVRGMAKLRHFEAPESTSTSLPTAICGTGYWTLILGKVF